MQTVATSNCSTTTRRWARNASRIFSVGAGAFSTSSRPAWKEAATDELPDDYRAKLIKFIEMHGNSELMGVLPEREWILRAPTLQRKLALTAKVQDEVGHSQLIYRVVEDLGKPREQCLDDLISG